MSELSTQMIIMTAEPPLSSNCPHIFSKSALEHQYKMIKKETNDWRNMFFVSLSLSRLFAGLEAEDEYYRILFIVLKTRLADIGRRLQYSLYSFNIKIKYQPQDL